VNFTGFSQNDTDSSKIALETSVAKLIVKDLLKGDALEKENRVLATIIITKDSTLSSKDSTIATQAEINKNLQTVVDVEREKYEESQESNKDLQKALRRANFKTTIYKIGTIIGAICLTILILPN